MLYLYTGTPGSSKTLNAIKMICEDANFKDRPVYYFNIKEVTLPWTELTEDECLKWFELPAGSVVFIDECQRIFRPRVKSAKVPPHVEQLETHRHLGIDIVVCTQSTNLVDANLLAQVEAHRHLERRFGKEEANQFQWEKACTAVTAKNHRSQAVVTNIKFDKKYYGCYKSAETHTRKPSVPLKLRVIQGFIVVTVLAFVGNFIYILYDARSSATAAPTETDLQPKNDPIPYANYPADSYSDVVELESNPDLPRYAGLPWTAPKYDELMKPKSVPLPRACVHFSKRNECKCYTQQGTQLDIEHNLCIGIVKRGYFDETKPDIYYEDDQDQGGREQVASSQTEQKLKSINRARIGLIEYDKNKLFD